MIDSTQQPQWRKSRRCSNGSCVEVAKVGPHYLVRDSKSPESGSLEFTGEEWEAFVAGVRSGDFDFA